MALGPSEKLAIRYHDIFNYPLTKKELKTWRINTKTSDIMLKDLLKKASKIKVENKGSFYFLEGRGEVIKKRLQKEKYSKRKLKIAKRAAKLLSKIPYVRFVGVTGALAMKNAGTGSDVDLMIITQNNRLWTTRLISYLLLSFTGYKIRKPGVNSEKNKLCINLWLDEGDLVWGRADRNIYTAHEITQIIPLVNNKQTFEKFLFINKWIEDYWKSPLNIKKVVVRKDNIDSDFLERLSFKVQYIYMKGKITREVINSKRAIFHPNNWGKVVLDKLTS